MFSALELLAKHRLAGTTRVVRVIGLAEEESA
jgi:hypothetical protein